MILDVRGTSMMTSIVLAKFYFIGGSRIGLTYGPITSSMDDKKAKRRTFNASYSASNARYTKDAEQYLNGVVSGEKS